MYSPRRNKLCSNPNVSLRELYEYIRNHPQKQQFKGYSKLNKSELITLVCGKSSKREIIDLTLSPVKPLKRSRPIIIIDEKPIEKKSRTDNLVNNISSGSWWMYYSISDMSILPSLSSMKKLCPTERGKVFCYGKTCIKPRFDRVFGDPGIKYKFSGSTYEASPWPENILKLKTHLEKKLNCQYNFVVANWYMNGEDYVSAHQDNEKTIDQRVPIASVSIGASRKFRIRKKSNRKIILDQILNNGDVFVMGGEQFQTEFLHEVPKQKKIKTLRVNLTFRKYFLKTSKKKKSNQFAKFEK